MIERRHTAICADVTRQAVRLVDWDVEHIAAIILDGKILSFMAVQLSVSETGKPSDAMVHVDDVIAGQQVRIDRFGRLGGLLLPNARLWPFPAKDL